MTETRDDKDFTGLEVSVPGKVVVLSGSGEVWYQGNPVVNADITGSGDLKKI